MRAGWEVKYWSEKDEGWIPMPDFAKSFGLTKEKADPDRAERVADLILGRETPKEFREVQKLVGRDRRNRVFDFFGITVPMRVASWESASQNRAPRAGSNIRAETAKGSHGS